MLLNNCDPLNDNRSRWQNHWPYNPYSNYNFWVFPFVVGSSVDISVTRKPCDWSSQHYVKTWIVSQTVTSSTVQGWKLKTWIVSQTVTSSTVQGWKLKTWIVSQTVTSSTVQGWKLKTILYLYKLMAKNIHYIFVLFKKKDCLDKLLYLFPFVISHENIQNWRWKYKKIYMVHLIFFDIYPLLTYKIEKKKSFEF